MDTNARELLSVASGGDIITSIEGIGMMIKLLRGLLWVIALVAIFYLVENWRGKHAWEKYRSEREAKGDRFEWSAITPPPVPDNENFAAIPLFAELFPKPSEHVRLFDLPGSHCTFPSAGWHECRAMDFEAWHQILAPKDTPPVSREGRPLRRGDTSSADITTASVQEPFTARDVLGALHKYDNILREITEASRLPKCRFPIHYEDNSAALLPHLSPLRTLSCIYAVRAIAELNEGQTSNVFDDVMTVLRLQDKLKEEPLLMSQMVRMAMVDVIIQPVWEGLVAHRWNDSQLSQLQTEFANLDYFASYYSAIRSERIMYYKNILWMAEQPIWRRPRSVFDMTPDFLRELNSTRDRYWDAQLQLLGLAPSGWLYHNAVAVDRFFVETIANEVNPEKRRIHPESVRQATKLQMASANRPYEMLVRAFAVGKVQMPRTIAQYQTGVDEAVAACALERYRINCGKYPVKLDELVPEYITKVPNDIIDGQPLCYNRTNDQFVLYSVGWNETDDNGKVTTNWKPPRWDPYHGDWVWKSTPSETK
jgi:hypothetical protein